MPEPDPAPGSYDAAVAEIRSHIDTLATALAQWAARDDTQPQPEVRQAANEALDAGDAIVSEWYRLRSRLIDETRARDDAAMTRTEALLRKDRGEAGQ